MLPGRLLLGLLIPALLIAPSAEAQETAPITITAAAGFAGHVAPGRPIEVAVTISSEVLFAGELVVRSPTVSQAVPVEIPAAGEKTYMVRVGLPIGSTQVRLSLYGEGNSATAVASTSINLKTASDQTVVAVAGTDELKSSLQGVKVGITGQEVLAETIDPSLPNSDLAVADYLLIDSEVTFSDLSRNWLREGGRVVTGDAFQEGLGLDLGDPLPGELGTFYRYGQGWVAVVDDLTGFEPERWSQLLLPTPYQLAVRDTWQSPELALMQSAVSGGDQRVPTLPWLLAALVGYAVVVGPVNFWVLRRVGRRELAWLTIPVLATIGVAGFWISGRERLQTSVLNHGTVIIAEQESVRGSTATVLAVGSAGEKQLTTETDWTTYPFAATLDGSGVQPIGTSPTAILVGEGSYNFALERLGAAGLQSQWRPTADQLPNIDFSLVDDQIRVSVENDTGFQFWAWGIAARGRAGISGDELEPGESGSESVRPGVNGQMEFGSIGDAVINEFQLWEDPYIWNRIGTLGSAASWQLGERDTYFFGFTDDLTVPIDVDGRAMTAAGTTLIVIPYELAQLVETENQQFVARLLDDGGASWVDFGPGYLNVQTRQMTVGWNLPLAVDSDPTLNVVNLFGEVPRFLEIFDWGTSQFVAIEPEDVIDLNRFRNITGDVVVKASVAEPEDIDVAFETTMSPFGFTLEW